MCSPSKLICLYRTDLRTQFLCEVPNPQINLFPDYGIT